MRIPSPLWIRSTRRLTVWGSSIFVAHAAIAAAQQIDCPAAIPAASIKVIGVPAEWQPDVTKPLYLHAAAPIDGPPGKFGELAEFTTHRGKMEWSYTYPLEGNFPDGKWMQCAYGAMNEVTLSKKIDDSVTKCKLTYRKGKNPAQHEIQILCQ